MQHLHSPDSRGYLTNDTICAISTELGGAIAIVRVSGEKAFESLSQVIGEREIAYTAEARKLHRAKLYSPEKIAFDDALFVKFIKPSSYTGEDMVEYHIHGGRAIAHKLLETLISLGLRQALPGEFSFRSVRNGKLDLFQAQAVADLIAASNDGAISLALEKLSGIQSKILGDLRSELRSLAVLSEVGIDFSDQDVEEVSLKNLRKRLAPLQQKLILLSESFQRGQKLQEGIKVAFFGAPNAGKSSFFNALLGQNRSIVSKIAGTTRDVVHEKLTLKGNSTSVTLRLEDTAGIRHSENEIEIEGIERTIDAAKNADLILFILDGTNSKSDTNQFWDLANSKLGKEISLKTIGILTKADLLSESVIMQNREHARSLGIPIWVPTSALTGLGIPEAIDEIVRFCEVQTHRETHEILLTRLEHYQAVTLALEHLDRANHACELDLFASDLRQALHTLGILIGETLPDDILGSIFSHFCIGK
jgi:tRNA modification GTPase